MTSCAALCMVCALVILCDGAAQRLVSVHASPQTHTSGAYFATRCLFVDKGSCHHTPQRRPSLWRERERETDRDRDRDRETDRQTERDRERQRDRQRETERVLKRLAFITKGYSSTYLAMGFANVRAGTRVLISLWDSLMFSIRLPTAPRVHFRTSSSTGLSCPTASGTAASTTTPPPSSETSPSHGFATS